MERTLTLDRGILTLRDEDGQVVDTYEATTGRVGRSDSTVENIGPIPPGTYTLYPEEVSGGVARAIKWGLVDRGDWGLYRVPLHPREGTNLYGREGFFLHGGFAEGSAGCIDVGTPNDVLLFAKIKQSNDPILVIVSKHQNSHSWDYYAQANGGEN